MAERTIELREYLWVLWRRKAYVVVTLALVVAGAFFYSHRQTPTYDSSAQVLVQPVSFFAGSPPSSDAFVDMYTEEQIASSSDVVTAANRRIERKGLTPGTVAVSVPSSTATMLFQSTSTSPGSARETAQAYADAYLSFRLNRAQEALRALT